MYGIKLFYVMSKVELGCKKIVGEQIELIWRSLS